VQHVPPHDGAWLNEPLQHDHDHACQQGAGRTRRPAHGGRRVVAVAHHCIEQLALEFAAASFVGCGAERAFLVKGLQLPQLLTQPRDVGVHGRVQG